MTEFLRDALAVDALRCVPKLDAMARVAGLLGGRQNCHGIVKPRRLRGLNASQFAPSGAFRVERLQYHRPMTSFLRGGAFETGVRGRAPSVSPSDDRRPGGLSPHRACAGGGHARHTPVYGHIRLVTFRFADGPLIPARDMSLGWVVSPLEKGLASGELRLPICRRA